MQVVSLAGNADLVEFDTFIDWREHNTLLKTAFPLAVVADSTTAEIQFGHVRRPTHSNTSWDKARFETVMHRWVDLAEPDFGVALFNDSKYGYDSKGTTLRLTLLRSPTYPWPEADQGEHRFRYGMHVHHGTFTRAGVPAMAEEFNLPLQVLGKPSSSPALPPAPLLDLRATGCTIESIKKAQDNNDIIVRLWETHGTHTKATLILPSHYEAARTDLLERSGIPLAVADGRLALTLSPFEIVTLRLSPS